VSSRRAAANGTRAACAPLTRAAAAYELECLAGLDRRVLRARPDGDFLRGWHALLFRFPGLYPDNARDHGEEFEEVPANQLTLLERAPSLRPDAELGQ